MSSDVLFGLLMVVIFAVFIWAARRGGPLPKDAYRAILLASVLAGASSSTNSHGGGCDGSGAGHG